MKKAKTRLLPLNLQFFGEGEGDAGTTTETTPTPEGESAQPQDQTKEPARPAHRGRRAGLPGGGGACGGGSCRPKDQAVWAVAGGEAMESGVAGIGESIRYRGE